MANPDPRQRVFVVETFSIRVEAGHHRIPGGLLSKMFRQSVPLELTVIGDTAKDGMVHTDVEGRLSRSGLTWYSGSITVSADCLREVQP